MAGLLPLTAEADAGGANLIPSGSFDSVKPTYVPWAGVDEQGNIHGLEGKQLGVDDNGAVRAGTFGPSVAVADLNGDGKPDLVVADTKGFFWYYMNTGTPQAPAFTQGEVIPIWLGNERTDYDTEGVDNVVPRIQLADLTGNKLFDILAGTYAGKLFRIPNAGSAGKPDYKPTQDRDHLLIKTHRQGMLWCNYLSPFLTTAFSTGGNALDLVMGDGSYSANSIYLLHNTGSNIGPSFDEDHLQKIIPGMGLEHLVPAVVDWNNDGKPDVIVGDRTGSLNLYLNNSTDHGNPTFAPAVRVPIAGMTSLGKSITVTVADLTGNHLPNLLIGKDDGTIVYALNTGQLGSPAFTTPPTPLKGVLPPSYHYLASNYWNKDGAWGVPDELVGCVNPQSDPDLTFPEGVKSKYALKFWVWPVTNVNFPVRYYMSPETHFNEHAIVCSQGFTLKLNTNYKLHFWVLARGGGGDLRYHLNPNSAPPDQAFRPPDIIKGVSAGASWSEVNADLNVRNDLDPAIKTWSYRMEFRFTGQPTLYLADLSLKEAQ